MLSQARSALWAVANLPHVAVRASEAGFSLRLPLDPSTPRPLDPASQLLAYTDEFAPTQWEDARGLCTAEPELIVGYPTCDPAYALLRRPLLLAAGPTAICHAEAADAPWLLHWAADESLGRAARLAWLTQVGRILDDADFSSSCESEGESAAEGAAEGVADGTGEVEGVLRAGEGAGHARADESANGAQQLRGQVALFGVAWAKAAPGDRAMVCAALDALFPARLPAAQLCAALEEMLPAVGTTQLIARKAALLLRAMAPLAPSEELPSSLLRVVLSSSTLSVALAELHLDGSSHAAPPHVPTVAALAVRATTLSGSEAFAHPMAQLCRALPLLDGAAQAALFRRLLAEERALLPAEGSPRAESHHRRVRLWLVVGMLVSARPCLAAAAAAAVEAALAEGAALPQTRVVLQNVWARAAQAAMLAGVEGHAGVETASAGERTPEAEQAMEQAAAAVEETTVEEVVGEEGPMRRLVRSLLDPSLRQAMATSLVAVAAQLLLKPASEPSAKAGVSPPAAAPAEGGSGGGGGGGYDGDGDGDGGDGGQGTPTKLDESPQLRPLISALVRARPPARLIRPRSPKPPNRQKCRRAARRDRTATAAAIQHD